MFSTAWRRLRIRRLNSNGVQLVVADTQLAKLRSAVAQIIKRALLVDLDGGQRMLGRHDRQQRAFGQRAATADLEVETQRRNDDAFDIVDRYRKLGVQRARPLLEHLQPAAQDFHL